MTTKSKEELRKELKEFAKDSTLLIVAQRVNTILNADGFNDTPMHNIIMPSIQLIYFVLTKLNDDGSINETNATNRTMTAMYFFMNPKIFIVL